MVFTGVSTSTVYRRRQELQFQDNVLSVTDSELDTIILDIRMYNPNIGVTLMEGEVRSRGIRASHRRVWEAMRRVDPEGVSDRWHPPLERREYSVSGPNSVWHIDSNHIFDAMGYSAFFHRA